MKQRITIKNVKTFAGHDGNGWQATTYLDGKKIGICVDDGWGGGLNFNCGSVVDYDALNQAALEMRPDIEVSKYVPPFEFIMSDLVNDALQEKDIKRATTKEVWFQLEGEDASTFRTFKRGVKVSDPRSHMEEHAIIDAIVKVSEREKKAIKSIKGIRHATKRKELAA